MTHFALVMFVVLIFKTLQRERLFFSAGTRDAALDAERHRLREQAREHLSEQWRQLSRFDDGLLEALQIGALRLVRASWLCAQGPDYRIQRRQDLEALEQQGKHKEGEGPFLTSKEAVALVCSGKREIGVLSYGWLSPGQPDPACARMAVIRRALDQHPHLEAIFWDFPSLYQAPRTIEQEAAFRRALTVMGDLCTRSLSSTRAGPRPAHRQRALPTRRALGLRGRQTPRSSARPCS